VQSNVNTRQANYLPFFSLWKTISSILAGGKELVGKQTGRHTEIDNSQSNKEKCPAHKHTHTQRERKSGRKEKGKAEGGLISFIQFPPTEPKLCPHITQYFPNVFIMFH